ncbi:assimilatory sulfite reductase (NADPH) flavoprotein subunit [Pelistega europaea]|uniref:assimilatory sulfite reductase (NADPH) n=2 Tax=Pelistega europaea TaxID=106147 RepID=A0A7Y4L8J6_9BURK|nr:assimilatory sulfite reductase (NADPH) flavoprotein subunit [Pelistega europaea]NOL48934.1 assimilatory sulfite reductase (NADPH) flavoprotein subunit [Pelistega europaea]
MPISTQAQTSTASGVSIGTPISAELAQQLSHLNPVQLAWLSGYCWAKVDAVSGVNGNGVSRHEPNITGDVAPSIMPTPAAVPIRIKIISASQTGNARKVAEQLKAQLDTVAEVQLIAAADYKAKQMTQESIVLLVTSTQGDGEPPEEALNLHRFLFGKKAPDLSGLSFAVLGLGDSSYPNFCQAAKDFDKRLAELGAKRLFDVGTCDVDYQELSQAWIAQAQQHFLALKEAGDVSEVSNRSEAATANDSPADAVAYTKEHPFTATLNVRQKITGRNSSKDVEHIEIDLSGSGLQYQVGDALGVWFRNDEQLVDEVLGLVSLTGDESVTLANITPLLQSDNPLTTGHSLTLKEALISQLELTQNTAKFVQAYAALNPITELQSLVANSKLLQDFVQTTQIVDVLRAYPHALTAEQLVSLLRPLTPRLYSIASSQAEVGDEVHLTVGVVRYKRDGITRSGGASGYLGERLEEDGEVPVFIEPNPHFRLPVATDKDIIMIGAGTGIAPFRAFMQERANQQATGKNWLFFGNPTFTEDFLYQQEWQDYARQGLLNRYHFAWSRDQAKKVYVQDKIREQAREIWSWLKGGAYIYVCGDASKMAKDVEQALLAIIRQEGGLDDDAAEDYLADLRQDKRYQRDVY